MEDVLYWIWLQDILGDGADVKELLDHFKTPYEIFKAEKDVLESHRCNILTKGSIDRILRHNLTKAREIYALCLKHGIHVVTPADSSYPFRLLNLANYPVVLYVRGDCSCLNVRNTFGVIGSRTPSLYGENAARNIVGSLVKNGCVIVSGGALGIDTIAHASAIENGGKTVLVLGCGHGYNYLPVNSDLRKSVYYNGALVSEYPPMSPVTRGSFPKRNRIISGMSKGVVICEAAEYSGTFSTAKHALKQGRDLFVLPGDIESGNFAGSNNLITYGAKAIFSGNDILGYYSADSADKQHFLFKTGKPFPNIDTDATSTKKSPSSKPKKDKPKEVDEGFDTEIKEEKTENTENIKKINPETISKNAFMVYNIVSSGINELDDIVRASSLEVRKVLVSLTELEIQGHISREGPNKFGVK